MQPQMSTGYELSPQQKLFFERGREAANAGLAVLLGGQGDAGKIRRALQELVGRHEILRTTFQRGAGMKVPFQVGQESAEVAWSELDFSELAENEPGTRV